MTQKGKEKNSSAARKERVLHTRIPAVLEKELKEMAQSLHVSGQTLLITRGNTHVNLTNEGFMNARTNPTKFHEILKTQIDKLL